MTLINNQKEFETLFRSYYEELCSYAFYFLKEKEASEEVVQELFFTLWKKRLEISFEGNPKSYLYRATRNACLNQIKHLAVKQSYKEHNDMLRKQEEQSATDTLEFTELEDRIAAAIEELPTERRRIFVMSRYENLKYREIADALAISVKTVESQMSKALKHLKEKLQDYLPLVFLLLNFFEG